MKYQSNRVIASSLWNICKYRFFIINIRVKYIEEYSISIKNYKYGNEEIRDIDDKVYNQKGDNPNKL